MPPESQQQMIFDHVASRAARDEGIQRVDEHADPDWKALAAAALDVVIARGRPFTSDHVWAEVGVYPRERRALGPLLVAARRDGRIRKTGRYVNSTRPEHHSYPCAEWVAV